MRKGPRYFELSKKRRAGYSSDFKGLFDSQDSGICSRHFISGKPSSLEDESNTDWLPCLNQGHSKVSESHVRIGEEGWSRRKVKVVLLQLCLLQS